LEGYLLKSMNRKKSVIGKISSICQNAITALMTTTQNKKSPGCPFRTVTYMIETQSHFSQVISNERWPSSNLDVRFQISRGNTFFCGIPEKNMYAFLETTLSYRWNTLP
jgi:hypothetical protein